MNVIYEPKVYLVGGIQIAGGDATDQGVLNFLTDHGVGEWHSDALGDGDELPEISGRLCYMSFGKPRPGGNEAYLKHIKECGHGSVLEHSVWNFIFTGVSRSLTHELVRHRLAGYSQLSQRYVDESVCEVVVPPELKKEVAAAQKYLEEHQLWTSDDAGDSPLLHTLPDLQQVEVALHKITHCVWDHPGEAACKGLVWLRSNLQANADYRDLVSYLMGRNLRDAHAAAGSRSYDEWLKDLPQEARTNFRKAARGAARSVLPNATETKIFVTANARAWRHMIEMRCSKHADAEIRILFGKVWEILVKEAPNLFGDYTKFELPDGTFELGTLYRKV